MSLNILCTRLRNLTAGIDGDLNIASDTRKPKAERDAALTRIMSAIATMPADIADQLGELVASELPAGARDAGSHNATPLADAVVEAAQDQGRDAGTIFDRSRMGSSNTPGVDIVRVDAARAAVFKRGTTGLPNRNRRAAGFIEPDYTDIGSPRMLDAFGLARDYRTEAASSFDYLTEAVTPGASDANMPVEKSEGAASNEMNIVYSDAMAAFQTIRATLPVTEEALSDNAGLQQLLEGRMRSAATWRAEKQMLAGSGSAPALQGLIGLTGINAVAKPNTTGNRITRKNFYEGIGELMGEIDSADGTVNMLAVNPTVWYSDILGGMDSTGQFIQLPEHIRNIPLIVTTALLATGKAANETVAVLGDFADHADFIVRKDAEVMAGWMGDDFGKYQLRLRVVARIAFAWYRAGAFGKLTRAADGAAT